MNPELAMVLLTGAIVVLTAIYVVATISYTCISFGTLRRIEEQVGTMKESLKQTGEIIKITRENAERQLRAYVCVERAEMKFSYGVPEGMVIIKNFGQTPAYDVRMWIHTWNEGHPLRVALPVPPPSFPMAASTLGPSAFEIMPIPKKPAIADDFMVSEVGTTKWTIYVYGEISYRDAFGKQRYTKFRLIHGGPEGVPSKDTTSDALLLTPDIGGNEAD